jgi:hypothetical protein
MKRVKQYTVRALTFPVIFLLFSSSGASAATPELKPSIAKLAYFIGDWECSGKFDSSGKTIDAHQSFTPDLDGAWIAFRHDDKPPFGYHALAEWGWDDKQKKFVMTTQDSAGGVRLFYSNGWDGDKILWDGDAISSAATPTQRFTFDKVDDRHFRVSYFVLKNGAWARVDASTCSQQ